MFQTTLYLNTTYLIFRSKIRCNSPCSPVTGGYGCAVILWSIWGFINQNPLLIISIIYYKLWAFGTNRGMEAALPRRLLFIPPNPPYLLNYYWNGRLLTLTIHSNIFWSLIIASDNLIDIPTSPICLLNFNCNTLRNYPFWSLMIPYDWLRRQLRHKLHK